MKIFSMLGRSSIWGIGLGLIMSIPYFACFWAYGPFSVFFNVLIGGAIGFANGIYLILMDRYSNYSMPAYMIGSFIITFLLSMPILFLYFDPISNSDIGTLISASIFSLINSTIASFAIKRAINRRRKRKKDKQTDFDR